ncbi:hypothetical protein [[Ruminococcus] lactaris]|uniref:hypothetical protein n=1 Tax=[Ruminococcus] lactaris TaxID=46228 RepID=UPI0024331CA4|nr:hypothetical protein [[Ruminococcus] lactaris]
MESNMMKVDSEKIKEVLRHHNELTQQIHNQVIDIRKKIDEVEQQSLEMASYPKIDLSATGSGSGIHKDLADVYLNYQRLVKTQERELTDEMLTLIASARGIHRLYLCFQSLSGDEYNIIYQLYVQGKLYKAVEEETGLNHRRFEEKRKQAIRDIQQLYESDLTNAQIVSRHKKIINKEIKPGNEEYQQMTLTDILNIGNGEKDG